MDAAELVRPSSVDGGRAAGQRETAEGVGPVELEVRPIAEAVLETLSRSVAVSTNKAYHKAWSEWLVFCRIRKENPVMVGGHSEQSRGDEERLLHFCVYLADTLARAAGTVKNKLMGIRHVHVINGVGDPLVGKTRVWLLFRALKKAKKLIRRFPVTVRMLEIILEDLDLREKDDVVRWTAICCGFLFLLRGGEYMAHDGVGFDMSKVLRGADVTFWKDGVIAADYHEAEEISIRIRSAKADIFNAGTSRNHFKSGGDICIVKMMIALRDAFPERFDEESEEPLFRMKNGDPLFRSEVQGLIQMAAEKAGVDKTRYAVHSLRIGGACALLHAGFSIEIIQRWGRWASNAFQAYLWESSDDARGVAAKMIASRGALTVTRQC